MEHWSDLGTGHYFRSGNKGQPFLSILAQDHWASFYLPCCQKCSEGNNRLNTSFSVLTHWQKRKLGKQENKYYKKTKEYQLPRGGGAEKGKLGYWLLLLLLWTVPKDTSEMCLRVWHKTLLGKEMNDIILWTPLLGDKHLKPKHISPISDSYLA